METVEVVIKISKNTLDAVGMLQEFVDDGYIINGHHMKGIIFGVMLKAIANGTVLPKGHGRLIDADALEKSMIEREERLGDEQAIWESSAVSVALDNFANTIIEADKEVDNG